MSRLTSLSILILAIIALHGCASPKTLKILNDNREINDSVRQSRFTQTVEYYEKNITESQPKITTSTQQFSDMEAYALRDSMRKACIAYSRLRRFDKYSSCIDNFRKKSNQLKQSDRAVWDAIAEVDILNLSADRALILLNYDKAHHFANQAVNILKNDPELMTWEDILAGEKRFLWAERAVETLRLKGVSAALAKNRTDSLRTLKILDQTELLVDGQASVDFKKSKHIAQAQIAMALGKYDSALTALNEYDNISGVGILSSILGITGGILTANINLVTKSTIQISNNTKAALESDDLKLQAFYNFPKQFMIAKAHFELGSKGKAKVIYEKLMNYPNARAFGNIYYIILHDMATLSRQTGLTDKAVDLLEQAINVIEEQRSTIHTEASKIGFVGDKQIVYQDLVALLVGQKKIDLAFAYVERAKARALVDLLASKNLNPTKKGVDTVQNLKLIASAETQLATVEIATNSKKRTATRALLRKRLNDLQKSQPELASLVSVTTPNITSIQNQLPRNETLVEYYGHGDKLYAFLLDRNGVGAIELAGNGLSKIVDQYRDALLQPESNHYLRLSHSLYQRLIQPLRKHIKSRNLTIVPHGSLHYLPFSSLHDGKKYLIDLYNIRILPSASVLTFLKSSAKEKANILVIGNPDLDDHSLDLPGAQLEAIDIARRTRGAHILLRKQATETAVKTHGAEFRRLHFASHGVFDPEHPLSSGLLLAKDAQNDGTLTVGELYNLNLNADLVTLSACETALGKIASGDDVVGFTRGFLYAGAKSIVSSLWKVDDAATSELMRTFYKYLEEHDKRSALRLAQISLKAKHQHPYYWAAFQLTGRVN